MNGFNPANCVVIGASGGIGSAFVRLLAEQSNVETVHALSRTLADRAINSKISSSFLDYEDAPSIAQAAEEVAGSGPIDLVIIATGLLHGSDGFGPEKSLRDLDPERLAKSFSVNAIGPALVAKSFLPLMTKDRKTVFAALSARVGSISDNRLGGWHGYRAAKAALNQLLKTASIEHARRWPQGIVVGLHPGTVNTDLSKPFQGNVAEGKLFTPKFAASSLLNVIEGLNAKDTGKVFAWDGKEIPA